MNKKVEKFLEFKGKKILFLGKDGTYWIAIRPICEALGVEYTRTFKNIKEDRILSQPLAVQPMVATDGKLRKMSCLPEFYVYGWLMGIQSDAPGLNIYKWECYRVLYEYFRGTITGRKELLSQKAKAEFEISRCLNTLDPEVAFRLQQENKKVNQINRQLRESDIEVIEEEKTLFDT